MAKKELIKISELKYKKELYPRLNIDRVVVVQYAESMKSGAKFPPISVGLYHNEKVVVDGWHRIEAYKLLKKTHIDCYVKEYTNERDLYIDSVKGNISHGKPLLRVEKNDIIVRLKKMNVSPVRISNIVCISKSAVSSVLSNKNCRNVISVSRDDIINDECRNEVLRESRGHFRFDNNHKFVEERFTRFLEDLKKLREKKYKVSAIEKVLLLDINREINRFLFQEVKACT